MLEDENDKQVRTRTGGPLKKKYMPRDNKGKRVHTYADVISTGKFSNNRDKCFRSNGEISPLKINHIDKLTVYKGPDLLQSSPRVLGFMT